MTDNVVIFMLGASLFLGALSLMAFMWGLKNNQFDDEKKSHNTILFDGEDDLNDAAQRENKRKAYDNKRA